MKQTYHNPARKTPFKKSTNQTQKPSLKNVQDNYIRGKVTSGELVDLVLSDGRITVCKIIASDKFCLLVENQDTDVKELVYKHAIVSMNKTKADNDK